MGIRTILDRTTDKLGDLFRSWMLTSVPDHPANGGIAGESDTRVSDTEKSDGETDSDSEASHSESR